MQCSSQLVWTKNSFAGEEALKTKSTKSLSIGFNVFCEGLQNLTYASTLRNFTHEKDNKTGPRQPSPQNQL